MRTFSGYQIHSASNLNEINDMETTEKTQDPIITSPAFVCCDAASPASPVIQSVAT
jgi:hypothetical protein